MSDNEAEPKKRQGERNPAASLQQKLRNVNRATGDDMALVLAMGFVRKGSLLGRSDGVR